MFISFLLCLFYYYYSSISSGNASRPAEAGPLLPGEQCGWRLQLTRAEAHPLLYNDYALDSSFWALAQMQRQVEPVEEMKWGLEMSWQSYLSIFLLGVNNHLTADLFT